MLNIYKASAGSGKTHTLTREFLFLSFENPFKFKNILAVTFTNKAAGEMKERIINELFILSINPKDSDFFKDLKNKFDIDEQQIKKNAENNLSKILHNYSSLNISTIDSFVQKVIRSFAFELRVPSSYVIEMDTQKVANSITDELILKLADDNNLRKWLISFAFDKMDEGKKWDFRDSIADFAKQLFSESFYSAYEKFNLSKEDFIININNLNTHCNSIISSYREKIKSLQNKGIQIINTSAIPEKLSSKIKYLRNFFLKNLDSFNIELNATLQKALDENDWWSKATKNDIKMQWQGSIDLLVSVMNEILTFNKENEKNYFSAKIIKNNIYNLGIINYLYNLLPEYRLKNNALLISDLTLFLKKIIGNENNDAPFIYEKIGSRFQNIMIDEFQDTSDFQWQNFKPLIADSLANGFFDLIVGDVKQSIYRWRNGDWRLLHSKIKIDLAGNQIKETSLDTNWRSKKNIVLFNNTIFSVLPKLLQQNAADEAENFNIPADLQDIIPEIYKDVVQKTAKNKAQDGYVKINFYNEQNWKESVNEQIPHQIDELLEIYSPGDIAILVRTNTQADEIMQLLLKHISKKPDKDKYKIISAESLLLSNSLAVKIIINALKLVQKPEQSIFAVEIAANFLQLKKLSLDNHKLFSVKEFDELKEFIPEDFIALFPKLNHYSLFELIEKIISIFELNIFVTETPFIRALQEHVSSFIQTQNADLSVFLDFWEEKSSSLSVQLSEIKDAIQIMTVHKSKGLDFNVVIVPYLDWNINPRKSILWTQTKNSPFAEIPFLPLNISNDMLKSHFANEYIYELFYSYIDTLNILYVAFTRAKERIYSYAKILKTKNAKSSKISSLLFETLKNTDASDNELLINLKEHLNMSDLIFEIGNPDEQKELEKNENKPKIFKIDNYPAHDWTDAIKIIAHSTDFIAQTVKTRRNAMKYGILMHSIFEQIKSFNDVEKVIEEMLYNEKITKKDATEINLIIKKLFERETIRNWFSPQWEIFAEKEILTRFGETKIPDRVIAKDKQIIVIDYKFGDKRSEHKRQVRNYMKLLQDIYPQKNISGFLLYVEENEIENVII